VDDGGVHLNLKDARPEVQTLFAELDADQRTALAQDAWTIGLRALQGAISQAREAKLEDIGSTLLADMEVQLQNYLEAQQTRTQEVLAGYFDPRDGKLTERLERFIKDDGELATRLKQHLAPENSTLAQTLAQGLGESSPLFRLLSPTDSQGVVKQLEAQVKGVLDQSKISLAEALNPRHMGSPVSLFLADLQKSLKDAESNRGEQLKTLTKELDANNESSLLSQLVRRTHSAQRELKDALNPEAPGSAMGVVRTTLTKLIEQAREEQRQMLHQAHKEQANFQTEIREAIARLETRRDEAARSTHGGRAFEDLVVDFVVAALDDPSLTCDHVGDRPGVINNCKKGDVVVRFTEASAFAGSGIVIEAKRDNSYGVVEALTELEIARKNRQCHSGLFIMATSHAGRTFPTFRRYGNDVLVTWDPGNPDTHVYLHAALTLTLALSSRQSSSADKGDLEAIGKLEGMIGAEVKRLEQMSTWAQNIQRDGGKIEKAIDTSKAKLDLMIRRTQSTLKALNIEAQSLEAEVNSPIGLATGSLAAAAEATEASADVIEVPAFTQQVG